MKELTQARLKELIAYDPESGLFTWRVARKKCRAGSVAGTTSQGFNLIGVDGRQHLSHHLAWLYMTGAWPAGSVTHINQNGFDNRWANLRITKRQKVEAREITRAALMGELTYDPQDGAFVWRREGSPSFGMATGTLNDQGYVVINVLGRTHRAHRLAWLYVYGVMPEHEIDHINRNRSDNRIDNLRLANSSQNKQNTVRPSNASGIRGVSKKRGKWEARIGVNGKSVRLGVFSSLGEAAEARRVAAATLHTHNPLAIL